MIELDDILNAHKERNQTAAEKASGLRTKVYREHYTIVKDSVKGGVPLLTAIKIIREKYAEKKEPDPFGSRKDDAIWQAFRTALLKEGIVLKKKP